MEYKPGIFFYFNNDVSDCLPAAVISEDTNADFEMQLKTE